MNFDLRCAMDSPEKALSHHDLGFVGSKYSMIDRYVSKVVT